MNEEEFTFCKGISDYLCGENIAQADADYIAVEIFNNKDWLKEYLNTH